MQPNKKYEVIDEDLAHVFYSGTDKREADDMKAVIELLGHIARVVTLSLGLMFIVRRVEADQIDYNPPVTQAEDTAAEMGRANDEQNQRTLEQEKEIWQEADQARRDQELQDRIEKLEKEKHDESR